MEHLLKVGMVCICGRDTLIVGGWHAAVENTPFVLGSKSRTPSSDVEIHACLAEGFSTILRQGRLVPLFCPAFMGRFRTLLCLYVVLAA